ncbi:hypothetical protein GC177_11020 [bacterium]|nr:hypothetical protein [bacterium]
MLANLAPSAQNWLARATQDIFRGNIPNQYGSARILSDLHMLFVAAEENNARYASQKLAINIDQQALSVKSGDSILQVDAEVLQFMGFQLQAVSLFAPHYSELEYQAGTSWARSLQNLSSTLMHNLPVTQVIENNHQLFEHWCADAMNSFMDHFQWVIPYLHDTPLLRIKAVAMEMQQAFEDGALAGNEIFWLSRLNNELQHLQPVHASRDDMFDEQTFGRVVQQDLVRLRDELATCLPSMLNAYATGAGSAITGMIESWRNYDGSENPVMFERMAQEILKVIDNIFLTDLSIPEDVRNAWRHRISQIPEDSWWGPDYLDHLSNTQQLLANLANADLRNDLFDQLSEPAMQLSHIHTRLIERQQRALDEFAGHLVFVDEQGGIIGGL